jgi:hypothetical protein
MSYYSPSNVNYLDSKNDANSEICTESKYNDDRCKTPSVVSRRTLIKPPISQVGILKAPSQLEQVNAYYKAPSQVGVPKAPSQVGIYKAPSQVDQVNAYYKAPSQVDQSYVSIPTRLSKYDKTTDIDPSCFDKLTSVSRCDPEAHRMIHVPSTIRKDNQLISTAQKPQNIAPSVASLHTSQAKSYAPATNQVIKDTNPTLISIQMSVPSKSNVRICVILNS